MLSISCAALCSGLLFGGLGRAATEASTDPRSPTPVVLSPVHPVRFTLTPTSPAKTPIPSPSAADASPPADALIPACVTVFPVERVEELLTIPSTVPQIEAAFGHAAAVGGRPTRLRIEARGCTLLITPSSDGVQEAELVDYGSLRWLLARYGDPAAIGVSQGNLVLIMTGYTALLYPGAGVVALFASEPEALNVDMPVSSLFFLPPYTVDAQARRLNLRLMDVDSADGFGLPSQ